MNGEKELISGTEDGRFVFYSRGKVSREVNTKQSITSFALYKNQLYLNTGS